MVSSTFVGKLINSTFTSILETLNKQNIVMVTSTGIILFLLTVKDFDSARPEDSKYPVGYKIYPERHPAAKEVYQCKRNTVDTP